MKISHKLMAGLLGSSVLLAGLGINFLQTNDKIQRRTNNIAANVGRELKVSNDLTNSVHQIQFNLQEILFAEDELGSLNIKQIEREIRDDLDTIEQAIEMGKQASFEETESDILIDRKTDGGGLKLINQIDGKFDIYKDHVNSLLILIAKGDKEKAIEFWLEDVRNLSEKEVIDLVEEYQEDASKDIKDFKEKMDEQKETSAGTIRLYLLFSSLMSVGLYLYIYRSIYAPLTRLKDLTTCRILNLGTTVKVDKNKDEFESLAENLKYLTEDLSEKTQTISDLNETIDAIEDSIIILDPRQNIQKVNRTTLEILEYSERELIGKNISLFLTEKNDLSQKNGEATYLTKSKQKKAVLFSIAKMEGAKKLEGETTIWMAKNITQQYKAERELNEIETKQSLIGRTSALWEWEVKSDRICLSPAWKLMLGYEDSEIGNTLDEWFNLIHPDNLDRFREKISSTIREDRSSLEITYQIKHKNGSYRTVICRGLALRDERDKITRLVGSQIDVTQRKLAEAKLEHEIWYDRLTKLPNRNFLMQELQTLLNNAIELTQKNRNYLFGLIIIDIDRFTTIKNTMGYLAGERLLVHITTRLKELIPENNIIARLEGDKYGILVENIANTQEAIDLAEKIQASIAKPFDLDEDLVYMTASVGIATNTKYYDLAENMLADAEIALYQGKKSGKGSCILFQPEMQLEILKRVTIEQDLQLAIEQQQFDIYYKPILEISNKKIIGLEAVIRWQNREKGQISAADFIPVAEANGSIVPLSWLVMEKVCLQINQWQKQHTNNLDLFVSVNVYSRQFLADDFIAKINRILWETGVQPSKLKLEISEETITKDFDLALQKIQKLKVLGVGVYLDNCAKNYSSLIALKQLPVDTFKLDPSLANNIENDPEKFTLLQSVLDLVSNKGIDPIVQGVDKIKQTDLLKQLNCEYAQGAFFSGLLTHEVAEALIVNQQASTTKN
ncbi:MAG: EAL domain-containing protein [Prochloraceae cyanobacterium]